MGATTKIHIDELNMKQILDEQSDCYQKRIGMVYGDFKVIDIWYDWDIRKQMWELECIKCGKIKTTHNGKDYSKGKNKGNCGCDKPLLKNPEKIKKDDFSPSDEKWVGEVFGNWKVTGYNPDRGWLVECQKCGRQTYHYVSRIKGENRPRCTCECKSKYNSPNWIGRRFGNLVTLEYVSAGFMKCKCDCGNEVSVNGRHLENGSVKTCGKECVYHNEGGRTHGLSKDRLYRIWKGMRRRCYDPKAKAYPIYGGRGITICDEWRNDLFAFRKWALSNGYSDDLSIDRIDSDKGYYPDNCRWATAKEQVSHLHPRWTFTPKRKYVKKTAKSWCIGGVEKSINQWCDEYGLSRSMVMYRVNVKGMTPYEALNTPIAPQGRGRKSSR